MVEWVFEVQQTHFEASNDKTNQYTSGWNSRLKELN